MRRERGRTEARRVTGKVRSKASVSLRAKKSARSAAAERKARTAGLRASHGIVPALDLESLDDVKRVVEQTTRISGVVAYKLGLTMTLRLGLQRAIAELRNVTELPVFYDHQKAGPDVPDMAAKFAATCAEAGADGLILFPLAGPTAVDQFVGNTLKYDMLPIVGGDLPLPSYNASGGGYVVDDALDKIFQRAASVGARHFIVPGNTSAKVRHHATWLPSVAAEPHLFIPGIGALGGSIRETFAAAPNCRVYAIVGRAIYGAPDPAVAARRLADEALSFA
jgi:orotidine-5'-phosphate decarboxylase